MTDNRPHPSGALPTGKGPSKTVGRAPGGKGADGMGVAAEKPYADREWRKAERRRVLLLNLLPGRFQVYARRGGPQLAAVPALQLALVVVVGLLLLRGLTGEWLPRYAGVVVLAVAVVSQAVCRTANIRAANNRAANNETANSRTAR